MVAPMELDPIGLFLDRRAVAIALGAPFDGAAAVLATATPDGRPSARMVLVKEVRPEGFFVFTNYESRKGTELDQNPRAAICVHWVELGEQFRIEGAVARASEDESDAYFATRPRDSQIGAWASAQSRPLASRDALLARTRELEAEHAGRPVPRPPFWGGYRLVPDRIEHWVNQAARLHERCLYEREPEGWRRTLLAP